MRTAATDKVEPPTFLEPVESEMRLPTKPDTSQLAAASFKVPATKADTKADTKAVFKADKPAILPEANTSTADKPATLPEDNTSTEDTPPDNKSTEDILPGRPATLQDSKS